MLNQQAARFVNGARRKYHKFILLPSVANDKKWDISAVDHVVDKWRVFQGAVGRGPHDALPATTLTMQPGVVIYD